MDKKINSSKTLDSVSNDNKLSIDCPEPDVINQYNEIFNKCEQGKTSSGNVGTILVLIIIFLAVCFNVYLVEFEKYEIKTIQITQGAVAAQLQARLDEVKEEIARKNKDASDIVSFNEDYTKIRQDFYLKVKEISEKIDDKANALDDIKQMTSERIRLAENYKSQLTSIKIPEVLTDFYEYEIEFIDSDINLWNIINSYYNLDDFSKFDLNKINEETVKSHELYLRAQEELESVYNKYELGYFLKDLLIDMN